MKNYYKLFAVFAPFAIFALKKNIKCTDARHNLYRRTAVRLYSILKTHMTFFTNYDYPADRKLTEKEIQYRDSIVEKIHDIEDRLFKLGATQSKSIDGVAVSMNAQALKDQLNYWTEKLWQLFRGSAIDGRTANISNALRGGGYYTPPVSESQTPDGNCDCQCDIQITVNN